MYKNDGSLNSVRKHDRPHRSVTGRNADPPGRLTWSVVRRFSSGDLSAEADDADPSMAPVGDRPPAAAGPHSQPQQRAQQRQYASKPSRSQAATPASESVDMRLEFQQQQQQQPSSRTISAPTSPAKTRDSILQRVQSLTDAAKEKASSISNDIKCESSALGWFWWREIRTG